MPTNDEHTPRPPPIPDAVPRETTDRLLDEAIAAGRDLGGAGDNPEERLRRTLQTFVTQVRENGGGGNGPPPRGLKHPITLGLLKYIITALLAAGAAYGGMKMADIQNANAINANTEADKVHEAKPAHNGAATKVEFKPLEDKVQQIDKSVIKLGTKLDEKAKAQTQQLDDIKEDLRYLRRRRRD